MTRRFWGRLLRHLVGLAVVLAALVGTGAGLFHVGQALAAPKRADMLAFGVDPMPIGTAKQVERAKRLRAGRT